MAVATTEENVAPRKSTKRTTRRLIIAFVLMMLVLTLISNTLLEYSLPKVSTKMPSFGGLSFKVSGSGTVKSAETVKINAKQATWPVKEIKVKVGDRVNKGQVLLVFDAKDTKEAIANEQLSYNQQQINLEKLQLSFKEATQIGDDKQLKSIVLDMESAQLALKAQKDKINGLQEQIAQFPVITSAVDGIVEEVLATVGTPVAPGTAAVSVTRLSAGYLFKGDVTEEQAKYLKVGDPITITFPSLDDLALNGNISAIEAKVSKEPDKPMTPNGQKEISVVLHDKRIKGGEYGDFEWKQEVSKDDKSILVPNSAVRESKEDGTFVYLIGERKGSLGKEYFIRKAKVIVKNTDDSNALIKEGIGGGDTIVVSSDKPLKVGQRVLIADKKGDE